MITITKQNDGVLFEFEDSKKYLYGNGSILVPFNTLSIVADESDMITLKKAASNDVFISARYDTDLGYRSKDDAIDDLKDMLFAETGGGGSESGITSGEVQTMIDNSLEDYYTDDEVDAALSGKASVSDVTAVANDVQTVSGQVATKVDATDFNVYSAATDARLAEDEEVTAAALNDLDENKADASAVTAAIDAVISGKADTSAVTAVNDALTAHTANTTVHVTSAEKTAWNAKQDALYIYTEDNNLGTAELHSNDSSIIFNAGGASITANNVMGVNTFNVAGTGVTINGENVATESYVDAAISVKADTSAVTAVNDALTAHTSDTGIHVTQADKTSWNAKAEPYSAGTGIEISGNVISATGGGGAAYSAGTNISIDTGNTINCTLPITANSTNSIAVGGSSFNLGQITCFTLGQNENKSRQNGVAAARQCSIKNMAEAAFGSAPNTVGNYTGDTYFRGRQDATLFTVGNGDTNFGGRHNALEIRQNGDLYFADTDNTTYQNYYQKPMVRLQDMYGALGGLKLVKLTQSEYDQLATKDPDTLYIISNVVS